MQNKRIQYLLSELYGPDAAESVFGDLVAILGKFGGQIPRSDPGALSERVAFLITYPDQVQEPDIPTLVSLREFCVKYLSGLLSGIHVLPFYPASSDDGFSVVDYQMIAPQYGKWEDVRQIGRHFRLMFDAVINHASAQSEWFRGFLAGEPAFSDYFIEVHGHPDLSEVVRPRALPLLTQYQSAGGGKQLWTTFSGDQIDLNYHNPKVLLRILEILLFYASQGAGFLRLDAIAYLWKELGTPCINLPQTHKIVQLIRAVLDEAAPHVMLITETNVPNRDNLSYFGDGSDEAQLIYNFVLPPLVLHTLMTGSAAVLAEWAASLRAPSSRVTFLNFLASHDGIGLNPVRGILPETEIDAMVHQIQAAGGLISRKNNADGTQAPYELNVNYFDALNAGHEMDPQDTQVDRFVTAHAILLALTGVPAIYFHSLFGSRGWPEGARTAQYNRAINREKLQRAELERQLEDDDSLRAHIFLRLSRLLQIRAAHSCFSPHAPQRIIESGSGLFVLLREEPGMNNGVLCIHNIGPQEEQFHLDLSRTPLSSPAALHDLITGRRMPGGQHLSLAVAPYESIWLAN